LLEIEKKEPVSSPQLFEGKAKNIEIDIAFMYQQSDTDKVISFVNNIKTTDGGTHESGFRAGLTRAISNYISKNGNSKDKNMKITGDDTKEGLISIVSVRVPEPQFEGQTPQENWEALM